VLVIDASALLELLLRTGLADRLMHRALDPATRLHAPHLVDVEVLQGLRRLLHRKQITALRAEQVLEDLSQLLIERHPHQPLIARIWEMRDSLSAYDSAYVALAEALAAPLLTCDGKLARAHGHRAAIELVAS